MGRATTLDARVVQRTIVLITAGVPRCILSIETFIEARLVLL